MKKVLFSATVDSHILHFHIPYLKMFHDKGYEVHVATNGNEKIPYCDVKHKISFERSPFKINNLKAIKQLKKVIEEEKFDIIHCHTPMGSVVTRIAAKKARKKFGTRVIYTAHGFHFYKGAPIVNWLMFYPVEKWLSQYTDCLITINEEDYNLAKNKFKAKQIEFINGVGVDKNKFNKHNKENQELRRKLALKEDDFVIIYVAELNKNKNQIMLIKVVNKIIKKYQNIKLLLVGNGNYFDKYQEEIKKSNLEKSIKLLGYRNDIPDLLQISDCCISTSQREGLPINIIEACMSGLPVIASDIRGQRDLVENNKNGYVFIKNSSEELEKSIIKMLKLSKEERKAMGQSVNEKINKYNLDEVLDKYINVIKELK